MTFLQLFFALIIRTDAMDGKVSAGFMGVFMVFFNFAVAVFSVFSEFAEDLGGIDSMGEALEEMIEVLGLAFASLCAFLGIKKCMKKLDTETEEERIDEIEHTHRVRRKDTAALEAHLFSLRQVRGRQVFGRTMSGRGANLFVSSREKGLDQHGKTKSGVGTGLMGMP